MTNVTRNKLLTILGVDPRTARKAFGLPVNPAKDVEKLRYRFDTQSFDFYSPEEVHALERAAADLRKTPRST